MRPRDPPRQGGGERIGTQKLLAELILFLIFSKLSNLRKFNLIRNGSYICEFMLQPVITDQKANAFAMVIFQWIKNIFSIIFSIYQYMTDLDQIVVCNFLPFQLGLPFAIREISGVFGLAFYFSLLKKIKALSQLLDCLERSNWRNFIWFLIKKAYSWIT